MLLSRLEAIVSDAVKTSLVWHNRTSVFLLVSHFLSLSFSIKCSDTTTGKILSIACVLCVALGALGLVLPKQC